MPMIDRHTLLVRDDAGTDLGTITYDGHKLCYFATCERCPGGITAYTFHDAYAYLTKPGHDCYCGACGELVEEGPHHCDLDPDPEPWSEHRPTKEPAPYGVILDDGSGLVGLTLDEAEHLADTTGGTIAQEPYAYTGPFGRTITSTGPG